MRGVSFCLNLCVHVRVCALVYVSSVIHVTMVTLQLIKLISPSGLRRCVQVEVSSGGVGSNPTSDITFGFR